MSTENCGSTECIKTDSSTFCSRKTVSWTAIIVGAFVGLGLTFLLELFNVAISLSIVTTTKEGAVSLAIGGFIGIIIGIIAAMFTAGYTAGYLGRGYCIKRNLGALYGFTTWCVALILTVALTSHLGHYVADYTHFIANPTTIIMPPPPGVEAVAPNSVVAVEVEPLRNLGIGTFLVFVLFFIGALSSCFGGHVGMYGCCAKSCRCGSSSCACCCKKDVNKTV